jgi:endonuclease/exonuclease/phosphatase (EEP) superfamily protein YafD
MPPAGRGLAARRDAHLAALGDAVGAVAGPRLLVGDLNVVPWAPAFRDLARRGGLIDARLGQRLSTGTWPAGLPALLRVPIDHALASPDLPVTHLEVGPAYGSDHRPLRVEVALPRP